MIKKIMGVLLCAAVCMAAVAPVIAQPSLFVSQLDIDWPQFHYDEAHVGFSPSEAPNTSEIAWVSEDIGAVPLSSLIVANGKVFAYCSKMHVDSDYSYLVALDESNGERIWTTQIATREYGSWATPAYTDGSVFVSSRDKVYRIDADGGAVIWEFKSPGGYGSFISGPVVTSRAVYVGDWNGCHYYCIDKNNGTEIWDFTVSGYAQSVPAIAYDTVYFGSAYSGDNRVYCVDACSGKEVWNTSFPIDKSVCGSVTIADKIVYLTTYDFCGTGIFYALNAVNGSKVWEHTIERTDSTPAYYPSPVRDYVYAAGGFTTKEVCCFDAKNGSLVWRVSGLGSWTNSPVVSKDGKVFVGKEGGGGMTPGYVGLYCLDALTGDELWHTEYGGSSPAIANGFVYTIGADGRVYAFGNSTLPDLAVEANAPDNEYVVGKKGNITATIENIGKANVTTTFKVELRHKVDVLAEQTVNPPLNISNLREVVFEWTPEEPGEHRLTVEVDPPPGNVSKSNPRNNIAFVIVTVESSNMFDTDHGTYPSICGTHYGAIILKQNISVNRIYTYPCAGTGGHTEHVKIWNESTGECVVAGWKGYTEEYHNLSFNTTLTLRKGVVYSYIITTGSYPQIIHAPYKHITSGNITCTRFEDANGKEYDDWLPAFRLWYAA